MGLGSLLGTIAMFIVAWNVNAISALADDVANLQQHMCTEEECEKLSEAIAANTVAVGRLIEYNIQRGERIDENMVDIKKSLDVIEKKLDKRNDRGHSEDK